jgi:hypothetical protein
MLTTRRSVTCAAYLVFAFGCSESQETGPRWVQVEDKNGHIVHYPEGEEPLPVASTASGNVAQLPAADDAETRQRGEDDRDARVIAEWRKDREEQARRDRQEELAREEATRKLRQEWARQARESRPNSIDQETYRRLAKHSIDQETYRRQAREQDILASQRAEALRQQQETAGWLRIQRQQDIMLLNLIRSGNGGGVDDRFSRPIDP